MILPSILKSLTYRFPSSSILKSAVSVVGVAISIIAPFVKEGGNSAPAWLPTPTSSHPSRTVPIIVQGSPSVLFHIALLSACLGIALAATGTLWARNCPCGRLSRLPPPGPPAPPPPPPPPPAPNGAGDNANANNNDAPIGDDGDGGDHDDDNPFQAGDVDDAQQDDGLAVAAAPAPEDPAPPPGGVEEDDYLPREKASGADFGWLAFLLGFLAVQFSRRKRAVEITDLNDAVVATVSQAPRRRSSAAHIRPAVTPPSLPMPSVPLPVPPLAVPTAKSMTIPGLLWNDKLICQAAVQTPEFRPASPTPLAILHVRSAMELDPTSTVARIIQETLIASMAVAVYSPTPVHHQLGFLDRKTFLSLALLPWLVFAGAIVLLIKSRVSRTDEDADEQVLIASSATAFNWPAIHTALAATGHCRATGKHAGAVVFGAKDGGSYGARASRDADGGGGGVEEGARYAAGGMEEVIRAAIGLNGRSSKTKVGRATISSGKKSTKGREHSGSPHLVSTPSVIPARTFCAPPH
ncbi:hypothetical protein R3P38DRAFT_2756800 [Favolaschia claudopus]|uniref:Uncharacterized protein n=1 Tax=Favolaschia claudopus TaxID=2862362 RepID=A0AAW0EIH5_9AGAR